MKKDAEDAETAIISSSEEVILDCLERDIAAQPERLQPVTAEQVRRIQSMDVVHLNQKQLAARWGISEATLERWRSVGIDQTVC